MELSEHELYRTAFSNVELWLEQDKRTLVAMRKLLTEKSLSPKERYELGSFYWCVTIVGVFNRLKEIRDMTGRSLYKRKGENKSDLIKDWIIYNYHIYMTIYQSIQDVSLQLTNEILDLGIPERQCQFHTICENRRLKAANLNAILNRIHKTTEEHRKGKNLLLHQGKGTSPPIRMVSPNVFDISDLAKNTGMDERVVRFYLDEFLAVKDKAQLIDKMLHECEHIEIQIEKLFNQLVPQYYRIHSFYQH